jgi:hypothetical protein
MSAYPPPNENSTIYDSNVFRNPFTAKLTRKEAESLYLNFPLAQGEETLPALVVGGTETISGNSTYASNMIMSGTPSVNYQQYPDGTKQYEAFSGTHTNADNVLTNGATTAGTYPVSYLPVGTTDLTYQPNNFDSAGNHLTYNPSTNAFSVGGTTNGRININGTGGNLTIAGTGTAISCPNATAVSLPSANITANALTCPTINRTTGVNLQYNGSTKLSTTNTGVNCGVINNATGVALKIAGTNAIQTSATGITHTPLNSYLQFNYNPSTITSTDLGYKISITITSAALVGNTNTLLHTFTRPAGTWIINATYNVAMYAEWVSLAICNSVEPVVLTAQPQWAHSQPNALRYTLDPVGMNITTTAIHGGLAPFTIYIVGRTGNGGSLLPGAPNPTLWIDLERVA